MHALERVDQKTLFGTYNALQHPVFKDEELILLSTAPTQTESFFHEGHFTSVTIETEPGAGQYPTGVCCDNKVN